MSGKRVVITGMGIVSCVGNSVAETWDSVVNGRCGISRVTLFDPSDLKTQIAGEVHGLNPEDFFPPKEVHRTDDFCVYAVAAFTEKHPARKLSYFLVVAFPAFVASYFSVPQRFYDTRCVTDFFEECGEEITPDTLIIAHGSNVHAVCYTFHRNDLVMNVSGELDYGLTYPDAAGREVPGCDVRKFVADYPDKNRRIVMFFPANRYYDHKAKNLLPPAILEKKSIPSDPETKKADGMVFARFQ